MNDLIIRGLKTGGLMTAATATAMLVSSTVERGSPWASLNAMATGIGVGGRRVGSGFRPRVTPVGFATLAGGLIVWGLGYEAVLGKTGRRMPLVSGLLSALGGYAFDEIVLPRWLVPNFKRKMGLGGTIAKYTALGLASAVSARWLGGGRMLAPVSKPLSRFRRHEHTAAAIAP